MTHCPSCGRYIGPHEACPYCGARLAGRTSIRAVKIAAVALATVGLAALWFAATRAEVPLIQIGQAGATMNMAYVRIEGCCTRAPSYNPESESLSFWVEDDTGEMYVSAYRTETRTIIEQGHVPALGDMVEVAGTLRVREDFLSLTINVPEQLRITRAEPVDRDIGTIAPEDQYLRVRVRGQVREIYEPYQGLTLITIRDGTGSIPIVVSEDLIALSPVSPTLPIGQPVEVVAAVSLYGDTPQLVPASVADVVPFSQAVPIAAEKQIGELTTTDVGQLAIVRGTVTEVDPFSAGVKLTLDDGTGTIILLLWQSVYDGLPDPAALNVGAEVQAQGEISQYRGELEVIPELAEDVQVLVAAAPPAEMTVGALTTADVGRVVTLRGTLGLPDPFSAGLKFLLDDGTGQIILLLWSDVYESVAEELGAGTQVVVTGEIAEYRGELEVIPELAEDMQVLVAAAPPAEMTVGALTTADVGRVVTLHGTLGLPDPFSAGLKFLLDDGTGQIILLLWSDVYESVAEELGAGTQVVVTGEIAEYRGELELIPRNGGEIQVTGVGAVPPPIPATAGVEARAIGDVTSADVETILLLTGVLGKPETFSAGVKFPLEDDTGTIILLLWQNVYETIPDADQLVAGARVEVVGQIEEYRGELEIIPEADGVRVVE